MWDRFKNGVFNALASRAGRIVSVLGVLISGYITNFLVNHLRWEVGEAERAFILTVTTGFVGIMVESVIGSINKDGMEAIQREIQKVVPDLPVDRWASKNGVTVEAVRQLVANQHSPLDIQIPDSLKKP